MIFQKALSGNSESSERNATRTLKYKKAVVTEQGMVLGVLIKNKKKGGGKV